MSYDLRTTCLPAGRRSTNYEFPPKFIDTHCHLDFPEFDTDRDAVLMRAQEAGVKSIINIGASLKSSRQSVALAEKYEQVYASVGIHPHEADGFCAEIEQALRTLVLCEKVVAIGEIGLDYYRNYSTPQNQKALFVSLLRLAKEFELPVVLHCRNAQEELLGSIKDFLPMKAVVHCFSGDESFLRECLRLGFFVSFTCNITYKNAEALRKVVASVDLEKLMLETDAPYLSPEGMRGKRNEPAFILQLACEISKIKGVTVDELAQVTTKAAQDFFRLS